MNKQTLIAAFVGVISAVGYIVLDKAIYSLESPENLCFEGISYITYQGTIINKLDKEGKVVSCGKN